jgi:hypothetical protein
MLLSRGTVALVSRHSYPVAVPSRRHSLGIVATPQPSCSAVQLTRNNIGWAAPVRLSVMQQNVAQDTGQIPQGVTWEFSRILEHFNFTNLKQSQLRYPV